MDTGSYMANQMDDLITAGIMQKEIQDCNKLIIEFMGGKVKIDNTVFGYTLMNIPRWAFQIYDFDTLRILGYDYHKSFDWIMPVVQKINELCSEKGYPLSNNSREQDNLEEPHVDNPLHWKSWSYHRPKLSTDIDVVYKSVIDFIVWFNESKDRL